MKPLRYPRDVTVTEPEVFIIESLAVEDELRERYEGKALRDSLRIAGLRPGYYYVRTKAELAEALELFRHSSYRFLHISVHGSEKCIHTTLDEITNMEFAKMCEGKLRNRRVFFSACSVGGGTMNLTLPSKNKGMHSIAAPVDKIQFGIAAAFWTAFYVKALSDNPMSLKVSDLRPALNKLCGFFGVRIGWSYYNAKHDKWEHATIPNKI